MNAPADALHEALTDYLDGDDAALERAAALAREVADIAALLDWVQQQRAPAARKDLALRRLRHALGLRVVAGPVCKI